MSLLKNLKPEDVVCLQSGGELTVRRVRAVEASHQGLLLIEFRQYEDPFYYNPNGCHYQDGRSHPMDIVKVTPNCDPWIIQPLIHGSTGLNGPVFLCKTPDNQWECMITKELKCKEFRKQTEWGWTLFDTKEEYIKDIRFRRIA